mgnify:CR=1 FL=1
METKFAFTQARIKALPLPESGRKTYYDTEVAKLACRVSSTGSKTYLVIKRFNGKVKNVTLGKATDLPVKKAQDLAKIELASLAQGIDSTAVKRKQEARSVTLADCLEKYLADKTLKPRTVADYRYKINHDLHSLAARPVSDITEALVLKEQKRLSKTGDAVANAAMRVLRAVMNYAEALDMIDDNPVVILSKTRAWHKNKRRTRIIPAEQLHAWHEAVLILPNQKAKVYLLMALYMGFRSNELLTLEWKNVNLKTETITALDTKNHSDHELPIPSALMSYIKGLYELTDGSRWVFPGEDTSQHMTIPKKPVMAVIKMTGIEFSSHDLRRTFATIGEAVGIPLSMIKRLMNHAVSDDVTTGYIQTETDTLRSAINKVGSFIHAKVTQKDNVLRIHA